MDTPASSDRVLVIVACMNQQFTQWLNHRRTNKRRRQFDTELALEADTTGLSAIDCTRLAYLLRCNGFAAGGTAHAGGQSRMILYRTIAAMHDEDKDEDENGDRQEKKDAAAADGDASNEAGGGEEEEEEEEKDATATDGDASNEEEDDEEEEEEDATCVSCGRSAGPNLVKLSTCKHIFCSACMHMEWLGADCRVCNSCSVCNERYFFKHAVYLDGSEFIVDPRRRRRLLGGAAK